MKPETQDILREILTILKDVGRQLEELNLKHAKASLENIEDKT